MRKGFLASVAVVGILGLTVAARGDADREAHGAVPGSVHVPLSVLPWRADPASRHHNRHLGGARLDLRCTDGFSSSLAARWLVELGLDAADVVGGFGAWRDAGLPVVVAPRPEPGALAGSGAPLPADRSGPGAA